MKAPDGKLSGNGSAQARRHAGASLLLTWLTLKLGSIARI